MIVFYNFNEELFLSTPSARRATFSKYLWGCCVEFLSTPSARRATSRLRPCLRWYSFLSTPSARRATTTAFRTTTTPRNSFLSTPSARRATYIDAHLDDEVQFLSTPSARRATQGHSLLAKSKQISIHALREEGDSPFLARRSTSEYFYPRPPRGGRRQARSGHQVAQDISIHALREEGDAAGGCSECAQKNFYPRPPRGGRPAVVGLIGTTLVFLSTPSARRATSFMASVRA